MPGYSYVAVDSRGKEKRGRMDAENREEVVRQLKNDGRKSSNMSTGH